MRSCLSLLLILFASPLAAAEHRQLARPDGSLIDYYLDPTKSGYLSMEVQQRNLKLFGSITSEDAMRDEHSNYMNYKRTELWAKREKALDIIEAQKKEKEAEFWSIYRSQKSQR